MILRVAASGSKGNCYTLEADNGHYIILDCGVPYKEIQKACGYKVGLIDFALCTHEHLDHAVSIPHLDKHGIDTFGPPGLQEKYPRALKLKAGTEARLCGWRVVPFFVPHTNNDGTPCENYAYLITQDQEMLLYMTDWMYCPFDLKKQYINHFLIGVNYSEIDEDLEEANKKKHVYKGHASLDTAKELIEHNMSEATKSVIACHLSSSNADAKRIENELKGIVDNKVLVGIAEKGKVFDL